MELSDRGLEAVGEYYEQNETGPSYIGIRAALEWAGLEWEEARTGAACSGDGDEHDVDEVWAEPWVAAVCEALFKYMGLRFSPSIYPQGSVGRIMELERELAGLLAHAVQVLDGEARASLRVVRSLVGDADSFATLDLLRARGFDPDRAVWPDEEGWRRLKARLREQQGDDLPDDDGSEFF